MLHPALAQLSNNLVYSAMAVYTLAMLAFAAELAFGGRSRVGRLAAVAETATEPQQARATGVPAQHGAAAIAAGTAASTAATGTAASTAVLARPDAASRASLPPQGGGRGEDAPAHLGASDRFGRIAVRLTVLAAALHLGAVLARGLSVGRVPWGNMYEFSLAMSLGVSLVFLAMLTRHDLRYLGVFVVTPVLLTLGLAVTVLYVSAGQLMPALKSYWLAIHVTAAVIASGVFTLGAAVSVLYLLAERNERRIADGTVSADSRLTRALSRVPASGTLDRTAYRVHAFGFPLWTFAVIAGAIWAENAWGRYWGWDPKETWSFITWVVYAGYLHARATAGWRGRTAAIIALVGFSAMTFNYFAVNLLFFGKHSYSGL